MIWRKKKKEEPAETPAPSDGVRFVYLGNSTTKCFGVWFDPHIPKTVYDEHAIKKLSNNKYFGRVS